MVIIKVEMIVLNVILIVRNVKLVPQIVQPVKQDIKLMVVMFVKFVQLHVVLVYLEKH